MTSEMQMASDTDYPDVTSNEDSLFPNPHSHPVLIETNGVGYESEMAEIETSGSDPIMTAKASLIVLYCVLGVCVVCVSILVYFLFKRHDI